MARIGVTVCIITLVAHGANALEYDLLRAVNTLIGIVVGLAVSFFVWPARGRDALAARASSSLATASRALQVLRLGLEVLALTLGPEDPAPGSGAHPSLEALRRRLDELAIRTSAGPIS